MRCSPDFSGKGGKAFGVVLRLSAGDDAPARSSRGSALHPPDLDVALFISEQDEGHRIAHAEVRHQSERGEPAANSYTLAISQKKPVQTQFPRVIGRHHPKSRSDSPGAGAHGSDHLALNTDPNDVAAAPLPVLVACPAPGQGWIPLALLHLAAQPEPFRPLLIRGELGPVLDGHPAGSQLLGKVPLKPPYRAAKVSQVGVLDRIEKFFADRAAVTVDTANGRLSGAPSQMMFIAEDQNSQFTAVPPQLGKLAEGAPLALPAHPGRQFWQQGIGSGARGWRTGQEAESERKSRYHLASDRLKMSLHSPPTKRPAGSS